jgi:hypothetical protein
MVLKRRTPSLPPPPTQTVREATLAEGCARFEGWGRHKERCERAWDELGTAEEERRLQPFPGWEMMDADVAALHRQADGLCQLVRAPRIALQQRWKLQRECVNVTRHALETWTDDV